MEAGITRSKEELIKLIQNIPDEFVDEVREIIQQILKQEEAWDDFFRLAGIGESGLSDISEKKHEYFGTVNFPVKEFKTV